MTFGRPTPAEQRKRRIAERRRNMKALATPSRSLHRGEYGGTTAAAAPKPAEHRNPRLLRLAKDRPCLLLVPAICNHRLDTTVACHSNLTQHGKAGARKADDHWSVHGCCACHRWLDQGSAPAALKAQVFLEAHARQVLAWQQIAADPQEHSADRAAARWALARVKEKTCEATT